MNTSAILVVTGASGVGKTAAVAALAAKALPGVDCHHFDEIGVPTPAVMEREFGGPERWQEWATGEWVSRLARSPAPSIQVLDAQTRPSFVRAALTRLPAIRSEIVLLDCTPAVRRVRLDARQRPVGPAAQHDLWAAYLRGQADALGLPVVDTSDLSIPQVAVELERVVDALGHAA